MISPKLDELVEEHRLSASQYNFLRANNYFGTRDAFTDSQKEYLAIHWSSGE